MQVNDGTTDLAKSAGMVPGTKADSAAAPVSKNILNGQAGGMILISFAIMGCVLIAWGFQRNAKRKLAIRDEEYESILRSSAEARAAARASDARSATPTVAGVRNQAELAADVAEIATLRHDLRDLGRRVVGEIDERMASLEATIARADAVANRLEQATRGAPSGPHTQAPQGVRSIPFAQATPAPDSFVEAMPPRATSSLHDPRSPRDETRAIIEMAEQGIPAREIAQQLSRPIGQVELILALRGRGATVPR